MILPQTNKPAAQNRLVRLLGIIVLVATEPERWSRAELAERFAVSERTITKDLDVIRAAGLTITRQHRGNYRFEQMPPPQLLALLPKTGRNPET